MRTSLLIVALVFGPLMLAHVADAQSQGAEKQYRLQFRALGWDGLVTDLYYREGREYKSFFAPVSRPSRDHIYRGPSPLLIYDRKPSANPEEPQPQPIAALNLEAIPAEVLLIVRRTDNRLQISPMADPVSQRIAGSIRFMNLTSQPVAFMINQQAEVMSPGSVRQIAGNPTQDNSLTVRLASETEGEWNAIFSTVMHHHPSSRVSILVIPDTGQEGKVTLRRMIEPVRAPVVDAGEG